MLECPFPFLRDKVLMRQTNSAEDVGFQKRCLLDDPFFNPPQKIKSKGVGLIDLFFDREITKLQDVIESKTKILRELISKNSSYKEIKTLNREIEAFENDYKVLMLEKLGGD